MNRESKPIVLVPACNRTIGKHPFHIAGRKYIDAVRLAGCQPLVVPAAEADELDSLLDIADGVLLTGSPSNVHPSRFGEAVHDPALPLDIERDAMTLPLIPKVIERAMPLFAICRGTQEVNIALGGSLHQAVHEVPGFADHRDDDDAPVELQYGPSHDIDVVAGGVLESIVGARRLRVNSLHGQGLARLGAGLRIEARAPDGLVEAVSLGGSDAFMLGVQWHPEWQAEANPVSMQLLDAFGHACRDYRQRRNR